MKQSGSPKYIFMIVGLLAVIYSMADVMVTFFAIDVFSLPFEYQYNVMNDPIGMGILVGIPVCLLLLILERGPHKDN